MREEKGGTEEVWLERMKSSNDKRRGRLENNTLKERERVPL